MWGCLLRKTGLFGLILVLTSAPIYAEEWKGYAQVGLERLEGQTSYEIGGRIVESGQSAVNVHFPFSKLEFPLGGYLATARAGLTIEDVLLVSLGIKKSIIQDAGTVKDWDWGYWSLDGRPWARSDTLDIYSTSSGRVDVCMGDVNLRLDFNLKDNARQMGLEDAGLRVGIGYMVQVFNYEAVNHLDQWYPSYYPLYMADIENDPTITPRLKEAVKGHLYNSGNVLTYRVEFQIPFLEGGVMLKSRDGLMLEARLGYSYWVTASDDDHHLMRNKVSRGDCGGTARLFSLHSAYDLTKDITLGLNYDYIEIATTGTQEQCAPDFSGTVDQHIESSQEYVGISLGYQF